MFLLSFPFIAPLLLQHTLHGSKFFPFRVDPFFRRRQNNFDRVPPPLLPPPPPPLPPTPLKMYQFSLRK